MASGENDGTAIGARRESFWRENATALIGAAGLVIAAVVAGIFWFIPNASGSSDPHLHPTHDTSTPSTAPAELQLGSIYYLDGPNDPELVQVVDTNRNDPRLQSADLTNPTGPWDPKANWIDISGHPVPNPAKTYGADAQAVAKAFGSVDALATYLREHVQPLH